MRPELRHMGAGRHPVVVIDGFSGAPGDLVGLAAAMAPFPPSAGSYYPGLRRVIGAGDGAARIAVDRLLEAAAPFIGGAFDMDGFDLIEASFSLVTAAPESLVPAQRAPHFDSPDPDYLALLLYLSETPGTAFYRQRATGIERVDAANRARFIAAARRESSAARGYIAGSDDWFEQTGRVEGRVDRLAIYQGSLLHSGVIPPDMDMSADPRAGRLTLNIFVKGRRG